MTISAYVSLHDDWQILETALRSIDDMVDEIVVIDGTYKWMAPFFEAQGRDPTRSVDTLYDILGQFGSKLKVVNNVWNNEVEKRKAGFESTSNRYVLRADADEILFFDKEEIDLFFRSDKAVGEMSMPMYMAPGYIRRSSANAPIERQSFLFDRQRINSTQHLSYLWLVLPQRERDQIGKTQSSNIYSNPLAFNAHLTHWRPPESALTRARFYILNYLRSGGQVSWAPKLDYSRPESFNELFSVITAEELTDVLLTNELVSGLPKIGDFGIFPTPLDGPQEESFVFLRKNYEQGLAKLAESFSEGRYVPTGAEFHVDLTQKLDLIKSTDGLKITLSCGIPINSSKSALKFLFDQEPFMRSIECMVKKEGENVLIELDPKNIPEDSGKCLQAALAISIWCSSSSPIVRCFMNWQ